MKKSLLICIVIVGIVFVTGCIGGEKATESKTSTNAPPNQKSDTQTPDLIIKQSDVPGLTLRGFELYAFPKSSSYNFNTVHKQGDVEFSIYKYKDALPIGTRNVGQYSGWGDNSGRALSIELNKYDSNSNFKEYFDGCKQRCEEINTAIKTGKIKESGDDVIFRDCGIPDIGDFSSYMHYASKRNPDIGSAELKFAYKNYFTTITIIDETEKSLKEAIRIAKLIKNRLD